jgi:hypothetical protein
MPSLYFGCRWCLNIKETRERYAQDLGDLEQAPRSDPARALFEFLNLLQAHANRIAQFSMRHASGRPKYSDVLSHKPVDGIDHIAE